MERATNLLDPTLLELRNPKRWKELIKSFLQKTISLNSAELLKVRAIKYVKLDFNINNIRYILILLSGYLLFQSFGLDYGKIHPKRLGDIYKIKP